MATFRPHPWSTQDGFTFRFDWGVAGLDAIRHGCGAIVVVDVLRFSTAASVVVEHGGTIELADTEKGTTLRTMELRRRVDRASTAPVSLWSRDSHPVARSATSLGIPTYAGCLRNARAVADAALGQAGGRPIAVIAAGERWLDDTVRFATEDLLGAGAVLDALEPYRSLVEPCCSPAARSARASFLDAAPLLLDMLTATASGRQLWERGDGDDVREASRLNITDRPCPISTVAPPPQPAVEC